MKLVAAGILTTDLDVDQATTLITRMTIVKGVLDVQEAMSTEIHDMPILVEV